MDDYDVIINKIFHFFLRIKYISLDRSFKSVHFSKKITKGIVIRLNNVVVKTQIAVSSGLSLYLTDNTILNIADGIALSTIKTFFLIHIFPEDLSEMWLKEVRIIILINLRK